MPDLKEKLAAIEYELAAGLAKARAELSHAGSKGARAEQILRRFLMEHLPRNVDCGQGQVIDSSGANSKQLDVIITNEYHPFRYSEDTPGLHLIEGVSAVGEVKASLDAKGLNDAIDSALVLRSLKVDPGEGSVRRTNPSDARFFDSPPFFVFAFESSISDGKADEILMERSEKEGRGVDAVFVLKKWYSIDYGTNTGALSSSALAEFGLEGWLTEPGDTVLVPFLGWLHASMPLLQRYTPILPPYLFPREGDGAEAKA
jgi:hypothetical protein